MDQHDVGLAGRTRTAERDRPPDQRSPVPDVRGFTAGERDEQVDAILAAAALRDDRAAIRAFEADQRDQTAKLDAFVSGIDDGPASLARRLAKADRDSARADRIAAELDRYLLADLGADHQQGEADPGRRIAATAAAPQEFATSRTESRRAHAV
jgi:hypothetical protein